MDPTYLHLWKLEKMLPPVDSPLDSNRMKEIVGLLQDSKIDLVRTTPAEYCYLKTIVSPLLKEVMVLKYLVSKNINDEDIVNLLEHSDRLYEDVRDIYIKIMEPCYNPEEDDYVPDYDTFVETELKY